MVVRDTVLLLLATTLVIGAPNALSSIEWLSSRQIDYMLLSSVEGVLPIALLLAFGFVVLRLVEQGTDLGYRLLQIKSSTDHPFTEKRMEA